MARRAADLVKIPTGSPEQVRNYCRTADEVLGDLATEFECRRRELAKKIFALLKHAHKKGIGSGSDKWLRSMRITMGLITAALAVRVARHAVRGVYPMLEKLAGVELDGLRDLKYGRGKWRSPEDPMDV
ncbi:hypothetical protein DQ384_05620 [Sphaerisporangium album]|uniref:Uncharacterized protein n=1 Tax=Sphaerisporangium album TaxID=509200 RepID=A0A367FQ32_9ACTN|nr:hypothetical protein [Sphaerisporangium album]RCG32019.1 hypothetical protein DQ384_05620 [Sphaerisporangium album]